MIKDSANVVLTGKQPSPMSPEPGEVAVVQDISKESHVLVFCRELGAHHAVDVVSAVSQERKSPAAVALVRLASCHTTPCQFILSVLNRNLLRFCRL